MRSFSKFLLALLTAIGGIIAVAAPASASWPPPRELGGLDLGAYCRSVGYADAALTGSTAYDWYCVSGSRREGLGLDAACRWTYPTENVDRVAVDRIANFYDPRSVTCWEVRQGTNAPDFERYCTSKGHSTSRLIGPTSYDYRCVTWNPGGDIYTDIDVDDVCRESTDGIATIARFVDFYNASWECRV